MKTLIIIPLLIVPLISHNKASNQLFETIKISPLYLNKSSTIVVTTKSPYLKFSVYLNNDRYSDKVIVSDEITNPGTYVYTYTNSYTRLNNEVHVRVNNLLTSKESNRIERNITTTNYQLIDNNGVIVSKNSVAVLRNDMSCEKRHLTYSFTGFEGIYVPTFFHKIDLNDYVLGTENEEHPFFDCSPTLVVNNYDGAFDGIAGESENTVFNLEPVEKNNAYTFRLKDDYYVNPLSLKMNTRKADPNYLRTKHIYFPRNEMRNQDKYRCYFVLNDFGIDKCQVIYHFEVMALKNVLGDCSNSQYCIVKDLG